MPAFYLEGLVVALGIIVLMDEAFSPAKNKMWTGLCIAIGLSIVLGLTFFAVGPAQMDTAKTWMAWPLWDFYEFDALAKFYKIFALLSTIFVVLLTVDYRKILTRFTDQTGTDIATGEYYALPIFACAGMMWMASARDLAGAFVALELVTISFYIMVAFMRRNLGSLEGGVKYLILGALSTGFLVYGIAWVYGALGTMNLQEMLVRLHQPEGLAELRPSLLFGIALVMIGLAFKIGAVPMQVWVPDVYQGAPTPTTAFLSVASKAAGFILTIRFLHPFLNSPLTREPVIILLAILASATVLFGNLAAISQTNFKRLMAYSSIGHAGFLLLALAAALPETSARHGSSDVVSFYLATYLLMTLGVFFIISQIKIQREGEGISDFNGLAKTNPWLALALTVLLASLAGVPLTAGFYGKFLVFSVAKEAALWWPLAFAVVGAVAGFYYYFKAIGAMWWNPPSVITPIVLPRISQIVIATLTIAVLVVGIWPEPIFALLK